MAESLLDNLKKWAFAQVPARTPSRERLARLLDQQRNFPHERQVRFHVDGRQSCGPYVIKYGTVSLIDGTVVPVHLYQPKRKAKTPGILAPHGHAEAGKAYPLYVSLYHRLASGGMVVLAYDCIGFGERRPEGHDRTAASFAPLLAGTSLIGLEIEEARQLLGLLASLRGVDDRRLGVTGNSGGGWQTALLSAIDLRVAAAAPAGFCAPFRFVAGKEKLHCACNILPGVLQWGEMHDLLGLIAPRPCLLVAGRRDNLFPEDLFWQTVRLARERFAAAKAADRLEVFVSEGDHALDEQRIDAIADFFARVFGLRRCAAVASPPPRCVPRCFSNGQSPNLPLADRVRNRLKTAATELNRSALRRVLGFSQSTPTPVILQSSKRRLEIDAGCCGRARIELPKKPQKARLVVDCDIPAKGAVRLLTRGSGPLTGSPIERLAAMGAAGHERVAGQVALAAGTSLAALRVSDVLGTLWLLHQQFGYPRPERWSLHAYGWAGWPAVLAGLVGGLKEICWEDAPRTFWPDRDPDMPLAAVIVGLARVISDMTAIRKRIEACDR